MQPKRIAPSLTLYRTKNYPFCISNKHNKRYTVYLGIGGNIGNSLQRFEKLLNLFKNDTKLSPLQTSLILKNPPFGYFEQPYFYNGIIVIGTDLHPLMLLGMIQKYEKRFKRTRSFKDAPRTLDIDIILIQKKSRFLSFHSVNLQIPHPYWSERKSVVIPLWSLRKNRILHKYLKNNTKDS